MIVACRKLLSGVAASGVRATLSVADCPGWSDTSERPATVSPLVAEADSMTFSGTLPAFVIVTESVAVAPGAAFMLGGSLVSVTASISGTVNEAVCVAFCP